MHTNGYSLVRALVGDDDFDADMLLVPHTLYLDDVRALREQADVKALAHVTGGGILGNLERVLPDGRARADRLGLRGSGRPSSTGSPSTASRRTRRASVFNLGIGLCAVRP